MNQDTIQTLDQLFRYRVGQSPEEIAYRYFDSATEDWKTLTWSEMDQQVAACASGLSARGLQAGDRIGILLPNGPSWVVVDQAALSLGLVTVPLYVNDRVDNIRYVIEDSGIRFLFVHAEMALDVASACKAVSTLQGVIPVEGNGLQKLEHEYENDQQDRIIYWKEWISMPADSEQGGFENGPESLATIVYTSGTTGAPKGVMLSHQNILWNARVCIKAAPAGKTDRFLSLLPLSHMFERTVGYYVPMLIGAEVAYARSPLTYAEDLQITHPSILVVVPRVLERIHERIQNGLAEAGPIKRWLFRHCLEEGWQGFLKKANQRTYGFLSRLITRKFSQRFGGEVRFVICGGAPLQPEIAKLFIGVGLDVIQGYGLTETSPVVSVNRLDANRPETVGLPLDDVEVKIGEQDELLIRSPGVMQGYWNKPEATEDVIDKEGWFHTGDQAVIEDGFIRITGRLKDIIVLSTGEKIAPVDVEMLILKDPCIEQVMVTGNNAPALTALVVPNPQQLQRELPDAGPEKIETFLLQRVRERLSALPGYIKVAKVLVMQEPWTQENNCLTPTLKLKRNVIEEKFL